MPRFTDKHFYIIEGVTCSGKTTEVRAITTVYGQHVLLEHPPMNKGSLPSFDTYRAHQEIVFNDFLNEFINAPDGAWFVDYSPYGCFPFTKALIDVGCEECKSLLEPMKRALDSLSKRYECTLHRYLPVTFDTCCSRLARRQRRGDDTWREDLLKALIYRYDEFFMGGDLILKQEDKIRGLRDGCEIYCEPPAIACRPPHPFR